MLLSSTVPSRGWACCRDRLPSLGIAAVLDGGHASTKHEYLLPWPCAECQGAEKMENTEVGGPCGRTASAVLEEMVSEPGFEDWATMGKTEP